MREMRGGVCWDMSSTCVQGLSRPLGGYQANVMMEPHSPAPAWQMQMPFVPKQEPMDEDKNDSGINSGSDFHSSSPGSDSQEYQAFSSPTVSNNQQPFYTTPVSSQYQHRLHHVYNANMPYHVGSNPLTPPTSEHMMSPRNIKPEPIEENTTLTPHTSPTIVEPKTPSMDEGEDPLRRLQMSFEKNGFLPSALSPKTTSEHSNEDDNKSDGGLEEYDEDGLRMPKVNSHGKVKTFKCKQCDFVAITKLDFWEHSKGHIKTDKLLTCPKCPFVTEYKHHLEYHLRNHFGSKPFKCDKCNYSCVNKSMLNSHMKSHSNVYQYRCSDCSYATKYCHSLKLHLRKYSHKPAMVLNPDGTPNPLPIIDVYGTRRGPKQKHQQQKEESEAAQVSQNPFTQLMMNTPPQLQIPFPYPFFSGALGNPLLFPQMHQVERKSPEPDHELEPMDEGKEECGRTNREEESHGVLDLSKPEGGETAPVQKNRRKGRAYKLDRTALRQESSDDDEKEEVMLEAEAAGSNQRANVGEPEVGIVEKEKEEETSNNNNAGDYSCQFCNIAFGDVVLYTMHMGYHGYKDPFTCNMCGEQCNDKVAFFLHIARNPHT